MDTSPKAILGSYEVTLADCGQDVECSQHQTWLLVRFCPHAFTVDCAGFRWIRWKAPVPHFRRGGLQLVGAVTWDNAASAPAPVTARRSFGSLIFPSVRRLLFHPKGNKAANEDRASLFLCYSDANLPPPGSLHCPGAAFSFRIKNDRGRELDHVKRKEITWVSPRGLQECNCLRSSRGPLRSSSLSKTAVCPCCR